MSFSQIFAIISAEIQQKLRAQSTIITFLVFFIESNIVSKSKGFIDTKSITSQLIQSSFNLLAAIIDSQTKNEEEAK